MINLFLLRAQDVGGLCRPIISPTNQGRQCTGAVELAQASPADQDQACAFLADMQELLRAAMALVARVG
jgi:hypothetical protein